MSTTFQKLIYLLSIVLLAALFFKCSSDAKEEDYFAGYWLGTLKGTEDIAVNLNISNKENNTIITINNPGGEDSGLIGADNIQVSDDSLVFDVPEIRGNFIGKLSAGNNSIDGEWFQYGFSTPLVFTKKKGSNSGIEGEWIATRKKGKVSQYNLYKFTGNSWGGYEGLFYRLDNGKFEIGVSDILKKDGALHFNDEYKKTFEGKLSDDGMSYIGTLNNHHGIHPYNLVKVDPDTLKMFKSRVGESTYSYKKPDQLDDGWQTAAIENTDALTAASKITQKLIDEKISNIHSLVISKNGKLIFEEYFYDYNFNRLQNISEATISVTSALVGLAVDNHFISGSSEKVIPIFSEAISKDKNKSLEVRHLLTMTSGLDCNDHDPNSKGNRLNMYKTRDWVKFNWGLDLSAEKIGKEWAYCSGNTMILGSIIEKTSGMMIPEFSKKYLFDPLQITHYAWDYAPNGQAITQSSLYITPRDFLKIGQLYVNEGKWNGQQVLSSAWIKESMTKNPEIKVDNRSFGYLWWHEPLFIDEQEYDMWYAKGQGGTKLYVIPKLDAVISIIGMRNCTIVEELEMFNELLPIIM